MDKNILNLMVNQHGLIDALFFVFRDEYSAKSERAEQAFLNFSWEIKKHFFVEEEAVFNFLTWNNQEIESIIEQLKQDHIDILAKIDNFAKNLSNLSGEEIQNLYIMIKNHRELEEKKAYPLIDGTLSSFQKNRITERVNEIPINKNAP